MLLSVVNFGRYLYCYARKASGIHDERILVTLDTFSGAYRPLISRVGSVK